MDALMKSLKIVVSKRVRLVIPNRCLHMAMDIPLSKRHSRIPLLASRKDIRIPIECLGKMSSAEIYTVRPLNGDITEYGSAKPCAHCEATLKAYGVKKIHYSDCIDGVSYLCTMRLT
jgi:hypothetical protein